jgi:hypothetical protein
MVIQVSTFITLLSSGRLILSYPEIGLHQNSGKMEKYSREKWGKVIVIIMKN